MDAKHKKVQVVLAALNPKKQSWEVLLLQTNEKRGSFWQNVTGSVEENETFEEAALREAIEETGMDVEHILDIRDLNISHTFTDQWDRKVEEHSYLILLEKTWNIELDPKEHQACKWVSVYEAHGDMLKWSSNGKVLESAMNIIKRQAV